MPRIINLRLDALLDEHVDKADKLKALAEYLRVSPGTLKRYMMNRWTVLDRVFLERLLAYFGCDLTSLVVCEDSKFFGPFENIQTGPAYRFLPRPDADKPGRVREQIAFRDYRGMETLQKWFMESGIPTTGHHPPAETVEQLKDALLTNCIVIGSPMVNKAAELAICRIFGIDAAASPSNGRDLRKLPFSFRILESNPAEPSLLVEKTRDADKVGIRLRDIGQFLRADTWPPEEFGKIAITKGKDYAVVLAANVRLPNQPVRKLIVLAGTTGLGTEAAALALRDDYENLEPVRNRDHGRVWGIIEVIYKKRANHTDREFLRYNWRYRCGGRCPIPFVRSKKAQTSHPPAAPLARTASR